jgi:hypothetical protein
LKSLPYDEYHGNVQPSRSLNAAIFAYGALVPVRGEHEVVHDQLRTAVEQIEQADLPVRPFERVRLGHLHHR